ncbi:chromodomain-helicase-DNA-binding protein 9-like isoform X2 [Entelurus aequoreus]|uniref:chromodomain-helicase-DNA-binding protein 9-like isoform X2 n=1 Tax=Entelurus aequoreus TaxID=161455 RepID=UPI002B1D3180|nr:chromodomain-helicase-DNA-binding protein 9-like isoform X2 [Entelurus aequoreus]XP_061922922.1 chromodomain-helicase-DNA-binding protein 9-like isoform X2 [Entelurus aequoreus]
MDFFDDPNLFGGGLEGVDVDCFTPAPSFADELNLSTDFEPIQVSESLGSGKSQDMMLPASSTSTQQAMSSYSQQLGHYIGNKAQNLVGQAFPGLVGAGSGGDGIVVEQQGQYRNAAVTQVPQSNGLFFNSSSPMWGNQDQNGNMYHPVSQQQLCHQQQQQQQQRLHNQQLHVRQQQTHHPQHHRMRQQLLQQQSHRQQPLNQRHHQQINAQAIPLEHHHGFSFHQESQPQSQQQRVHQSPQQIQHHLTAGGARFHSGVLTSKSYVDGQNDPLQDTVSCLQQCGYQMGAQDFGRAVMTNNNPPMDASSIVHSLPTYSVSSAATYQPAQYPAYPGEPEMASLSQPSMSSASVAARPATTAAPLAAALPELPGAACQFPSASVIGQQHARTPVSQAEECPFRALRCSAETPGNNRSSEIFGESMSCYSSTTRQMPSEQPRSCGAANTNGYPSLGDNLLASEAQDVHLGGVLEPPDLLPELLPQLEAAISQQDQSNTSWVDSNQAWGPEHRTPLPVKQREEVMYICITSK